jgi:glucosamine-6-phosphate deaminase
VTAAAPGGPAIEVRPTPHDVGELVAGTILDRLIAGDGRPFLLGCPSGRTPTTTYAALGPLAVTRGIDLSPLVIVMVDEFLVHGPEGLALCDPASHYSCRRYVRDHVLAPLNAALPEGLVIRPEQVWLPDPADPARYDTDLAAAGGIDLYLLAMGASDGHVAFNPPGTPADSPTRIIELAESTRRDNLGTFPDFAGLDEVPRFGVSVGLDAVRSAAETVLLALGEEKGPALRRVLDSPDFDEGWPATILHRCRRPWVAADHAAASAT